MKKGQNSRKKCMVDEEFESQMNSNLTRYKQLLQQSEYSNLSTINENILVRLDQEQYCIYFYCGMYHKFKNDQQLHQLLLFFLKMFPIPTKKYYFVYLNHFADYRVYADLKSIFYQLPLPFFENLKKFVVVKATFFQRTLDSAVFSSIPTYLYQCTQHINKVQQLCQIVNFSPQEFIDLIPEKIGKKQFPDLKPRKHLLNEQRFNYEGHVRNETQSKSLQEFQTVIKDFLFMKPELKPRQITQYEVNQIGIPLILEYLILYFSDNSEALKLEGIFRKSVSIDEENQTLEELAYNNYDSILKLTNGHIAANLIKRFFANLKTPVVPYKQFQQLMHDQGVTDKVAHIKDIINQLPKINFLSLLVLFDFLKNLVLPHQKTNKMNAQNISICFAPCLMRAKEVSFEDLIYATKSAMITKIMIDQFEQIFGNDEEREQWFRKSQKEELHNSKQHMLQMIEIQKQKRSEKIIQQENEKKQQYQVLQMDEEEYQVKESQSLVKERQKILQKLKEEQRKRKGGDNDNKQDD